MRRIGRVSLFLFTILLSFQFNFMAVKAQTSKSPITCIDYPYLNSVISKDFNISGWALNSSGIKNIGIYIDNVLIGNAQTGLSRPDVDKAIPGYVNGANSGYSYALGIDKVSYGKHIIKVQAFGNDGTLSEASTSININKLPPLQTIDYPGNKAKFTDSFPVSGWTLNASGIKEVNVFVDSQFLGKADLGISRPDVGKVFPGYKDGATSGFSYLVDINRLTGGYHTIRVQAVGNDGGITESKVVAQIAVLPSALNVDFPANNSSVDSNIYVQGWALNPSGINQVKLLLDGVDKGQATIGFSRPDVDRAFPGYRDGVNSGFSSNLNLDLQSMSYGTHELKIQAIGNNGYITEQTLKLLKRAPKMCVDTVSNGSTFDKSFNISGWALNYNGIKEVSIFVDGSLMDKATIGESRTDVDKVFPGYINGSTSGFTYLMDINKITRGAHIIKVQAVGNDGSLNESSYNINIRKKGSIVNVDVAPSAVVKDTINISGWALMASGTSTIKVLLDGAEKGQATLGISRPDVAAVFPGYADGDKSGFDVNINSDINSMKVGNHTITLQTIGIDGEIINKTFTTTKLSPITCIDYPATGQNFNNNINVSGWAVNASGIKEVDIFDGQNLLGQAVTGLPRPDVNTIINASGGYMGADKSGYSYTIDINALSAGKHNIIVKAVGNDGDVSTTNVSIIAGNVVATYTNYDITLNDMVAKQMASEPAHQVYNSTTGNMEWRYAQIRNGQLGYYVYAARRDSSGNYVRDTSGNIIYDQVWTQSADEYNAIKQEVINNLDPDILAYDSTKIFQFLKLSYSDCITVDELNAALIGKGVLSGKGAVFMDAAKVNNVNPVYLVAHALLETGNGTSNLATGYYKINGQSVYNLFGIHAYDSSADSSGATYAYNKGWFSVDLAIYGGAHWISTGEDNAYDKGYINNPVYQQDTLYKMRWNPLYPDSWHKYATDVRWAANQVYNIKKMFDIFKTAKLVFDIPVYKK